MILKKTNEKAEDYWGLYMEGNIGTHITGRGLHKCLTSQK
jgi:hypothetical protein